ncbi:LAMI_0H12574g1_1 [Lachancea mirantina]|uniref:LAMI_0H12574g1_1 n=1 Tax=Lachancea mirantina TaxID=1230905 RepID=A0A1G4KHP7_9SACH|nr:LAMI_0H12574g1_1 [Lachancea mirantina]
MPVIRNPDSVKRYLRFERGRLLRDFLIKELESDYDGSRKDDTSDDELKIEEEGANYELEQILNMGKLLGYLERFIAFSFLASLDCFLHYLTVVPVRIVYALTRKKGLQRTRKELTMLILIVLAACGLSHMNTSRVYHVIKGQSAIKLYMMFGVLDMCDKMLSSVGQSLLTALMANKYKQKTIEPFLLQFFALLYLLCHGSVLIYETIALNVAVNAYSNSLWTLLLSMQFAEIKSSVFKRIDKEGLFQIAIADVVERFQMFILLLIIAIRNLVASGSTFNTLVPDSWTFHTTSSLVVGILCGPTVVVIGSEILVDWIKHAYITKFNRIRPQIYDNYLSILSADHINHLSKFQARTGLPVPALVVTLIVLTRPPLQQSLKDTSTSKTGLMLILSLACVCLMLTKVILHLFLVKWSRLLQCSLPTSFDPENGYTPGMLSAGRGKVDEDMRQLIHADLRSSSDKQRPHTAHVPTSLHELRRRKDKRDSKSLNKVMRYKMVSKNIW